MKKVIFLLTALSLVLSACSSSNGHQHHEANQTEKKPPVPIHVQFASEPSKAKVGSKVTLSVKVTQENKNVNDADEVKFEVWKKDEKKHKMINAVKKGKGTYIAQYTFPETGTYEVMYHVIARDLHNMEQKEMTVH